MLKELNKYQQKLVRWIKQTRPTIYVICRHVSSNGTFRRISLFVIKDKKLCCLDCLCDALTYYKRDKKRDGLRVSGCGMDMGFAVVYRFSQAIFPKGFRYRKNELHRNGDPSPINKNGGYALKHEWI